MQAMVPKGVTLHFARALGMREEWTDEGIKKHWADMIENLERAALELSTAKVDAIAWVCTSGSFFKGSEWDKELMKRIERVGESPATTTSTGMIDALRALEVQRVAVAAPYPEIGNKLLKEFLEGNGFTVVNIQAHKFASMGELFEAPPELVSRIVKRVDRSRASLCRIVIF